VTKTPLCLLAEKWGTDKCPAILHSYTPFYHRLLGRRTVRRVLELGILNGASLRMWRDYLPEARIFGLEINPEVLFQEERIRTMQCDASNRDELKAAAEEFGGNFDLIVDDASHEPAHQVLAAQTLLEFLAPGGIYVIEDVAYLTEVSRGLPMPHLAVRTAAEPHDDCLILVKAESWA
jgi:predicted O-methyltransferase YrrM